MIVGAILWFSRVKVKENNNNKKVSLLNAVKTISYLIVVFFSSLDLKPRKEEASW
jgi:hypothetical protein